MNDYEWEKMTPLEEVYAIRKRIAEKFGYSLDAIFDAGIKKQRQYATCASPTVRGGSLTSFTPLRRRSS